MGRFMARDYVTLRQEERDGEPVWVETSVGRTRINSIPAKVTREGSRYTIHGAAFHYGQPGILWHAYRSAERMASRWCQRYISVSDAMTRSPARLLRT